jgi:hypothetical protein
MRGTKLKILMWYLPSSQSLFLRYGEEVRIILPLAKKTAETFGTFVLNLEDRETGTANVQNAMKITMQNIWIPNQNKNRHQMTILILNHALDSAELFCESVDSYVREEIIFIIIAIGEAFADSKSYYQCFNNLLIQSW